MCLISSLYWLRGSCHGLLGCILCDIQTTALRFKACLLAKAQRELPYEVSEKQREEKLKKGSTQSVSSLASPELTQRLWFT